MPLPSNKLDSHRAEITRWYQAEKLSQEQIVAKLQNEHGFKTSERSLQRALKSWSLQKNGQRCDGVELEFRALFEAGLNMQNIISYFQRERPAIKLSMRSMQRRAKQWGMYRYNPVTYTAKLLTIVQYYFFTMNLKDDEILTRLRHEYELDISHALLIRIRVENNMSRKIASDDDRMELRNALETFFDNYQRHSDALRDYGRGHIYNLVRDNLQLPLPRQMIWDAYNLRFPEAVQQRREATTFLRREKKFVVPGPNYMWSMDGYLKLRFAGFEIYAAIDAYSRRILWCDVCRSVSLPACTLRQYLKFILKYGFRPWYSRTDHGVETSLIARAQYDLATVTCPTIEILQSDGTRRLLSQGHRISDSHIWGASKGNRKIEQWWRQLRGGATDRWIAYFKDLEAAGWFSKDNIADQVAVYAIYGPLIRRDVAEFVERWNNHRIRYQPTKTHTISGHVDTLWRNYGQADIQNWAVNVSDNPRLVAKAQELLDPIRHYDFDSFLSPETQQVCDEWLAQHPLGDLGDNPAQPHFNSYVNLKEYLESYEEEGRQPKLSCNELPRGGVLWYREQLQGLRGCLPEIAEARRNIEREGDEVGEWLDVQAHHDN